MDEALDRCRRLGARRVAVVPLFLFPGVLVDRIAEQAAAWAADQPDVAVAMGEPLGPTPASPTWSSSATASRRPATSA